LKVRGEGNTRCDHIVHGNLTGNYETENFMCVCVCVCERERESERERDRVTFVMFQWSADYLALSSCE